MNKKAVIFDGDGTLWRPKGHDSNTRPDTIYEGTRVEAHSHLSLRLVDGVGDMLDDIHFRGYRVFVVSAHPTPGVGALSELESKIVGLGIADKVDGFFCSDGGDMGGKTRVVLQIISDYSLDERQVYMVGDSYYYDYQAGVNADVNSFFIKNDYCRQPELLPTDTRMIDSVVSIVEHLES